LEDLVDKANDIIDQQISRTLQSISQTLLLMIGGGGNNSLSTTKSMTSITGTLSLILFLYLSLLYPLLLYLIISLSPITLLSHLSIAQ
jgi:hypothetical protein